MSYDARVHNVMIASPSDVTSERALIRQAIDEFNVVHAERSRCVLLPRHWESHSSPRMGARPQEIINRQLVRDSDLLVAVFWTRLGTPTGVADSGTVEEIEEHIAAGKPVMLYFSNQPVVPSSVDPQQYEALIAFKTKCAAGGMIHEYSNLDAFYRDFSRHLQQTVLGELCDGEELPAEPSVANRAAQPELPEDAVRLLNEAADDQHGYVLSTLTFGGFQIQTNGKEFVHRADPRSEAHWREMLDRLLAAGLLNGASEEVARITAEGYRVADANISWWRRPGAPQFRLSLASSRAGDQWTFEATVEQFDGSDVGDFKAEWRGSAVLGTTGSFRPQGPRKWHLPSAQVKPEMRDDDSPSVELVLRFRWEQRQRLQAWRWRAPSDFQTAEAEEVRE